MATITKPMILDETGHAIKDAILQVAGAISRESGVIYGFHINGNESDPDAAVSYLKDAQGMTPAKMNFSSGQFEYGSWGNAFFMPKPCMLKSDGTVDYYLMEDDYTKKEDGTASDIANTAYSGNAMMEWPHIWVKIAPDSNPKSGSVFIADHKVDSTYKDFANHNANGASVEHFYTPIYNGSVDSNSKMRSLSGQALSKTISTTTQRTYAKANNPGDTVLWDIECLADRQLINFLLILISKSLNTQAKFGQGATVSGSEAINDTFRTGVHNTKGLFFGTNNGTVAENSFNNVVKVFGMENYWGMQWRRTLGLLDVSGDLKYKLTRNTEDGSTVTDYNENGNGYISSGVTPDGTTGGYISEVQFGEAMLPKTVAGSASTYFCDGLWYNNAATTLALFGGSSTSSVQAGAFFLALTNAASDANWGFGAALSCKPL